MESIVEWNEIELRPQIERRKSSVVISEIEDELNFSQLNLDELEDYFDLIDIQEQLLSIQPEMKVKQRKSFYNLVSLLLPCKIPKLKSSLLLERDRIFATALTDFNESEHMHFRLLITIYEILQQKRGFFTERINQLKNSAKMQNYIFTSSSNNLEGQTRTKSFRRFKHLKSFRVRDATRNQKLIKTDSQAGLPGSVHDLKNADSSTSSYNTDLIDQNGAFAKRDSFKSVQNNFLDTSYGYEPSRRNRSFDLSALKPDDAILNEIANSTAVNSQYKYRLNDDDEPPMLNEQDSLHLRTNTDTSMDSFQTSLNSNFDYHSASGRRFVDCNSNHLNATTSYQYGSTGRLINDEFNHGFSKPYPSRHSLRSSLNHSWNAASSRKSSYASGRSRFNSYSTLYNERVSMTIFHRSIRFGEHWLDIGWYLAI